MEKNDPTVVKPDEEGPTLRGRWLGARLKYHRDAANLTAAKVAARMARAASSLSRWEAGETIPRPADVEFMLNMYGVAGRTRERLIRLADEARQGNWWEGDVAVSFADYVWLENKANRIDAFETVLIHGLLQTPEYAEETIRAGDPEAGEEQVAKWLKVRVARQERLTSADHPLHVSLILDEAALRRPIGGPKVMRAQLRHLIERAKLPNVEIRILPFISGAHGSLDGPFAILGFPKDDDVVYLVTKGGAIYLEKPAPFKADWNHLNKIALSENKSIALIAAAVKELS